MESDSEPDSRMIKVQALGRPFQLGMLYDCRSDVLIPGITLWNKDTIAKDVTVKKTNSTKLDIRTSDSLSDKADVLDIDANLKLSFMSGLITVEGSAKYLDDKVSSNHQERVTLSYHCLTKFESLNMGTLATEKIQHTKVFDDKMATHVVTGIQSGANVLFIFDKHHTSSESKRIVKGEVKVLVKSIPSFQIEGDASVKLSEEDKKVSNSLNCTFHGDVRPEPNPTTFEEAIKVYKGLNGLVGEDGQPLTIWLYPLEKLDSKAAKLVRDISINVILRVEDIFEGFQNIFRKCYDLKTNAMCSELLSFRKQVEDFEKLVKDHKLVFQKNILPILPKIRGGKEAETGSLADEILKLNQSPFSADRLNNWVEEREKQLKVITHICKFIEGIKCISSNDLEAELMDPDDEHTLCFMLEIPAINKQMAAMQECSVKKGPVLVNKKKEEIRQNRHTIGGARRFKEKVEIRQNRHTIESARRFKDFYIANKTEELSKGPKTAFFLSEVLSTSNEIRGSIYHFALGQVVTKAFLPPSRPENLEVSKISGDSVILKWDPSKPGTEKIEEYEIAYQIVMEGDSSNDNKNISTGDSSNDNKIIATGNSTTKYVFTGNSTTKYVLFSLIPSTEYRFKCRAVVSSGVSAYCDESDPVETLPESNDLQNMLQNLKENMKSKILMIMETKEVLKNLLRGDRKVYAIHTNGNVVHYSEIAYITPNFRLIEFSTTIPPSESSIFLEFDILKTLVTGCFLEMSHQDRSIGVLEILFSPENPKLVDHMSMLSSGSNGSDRWSGSGFNGLNWKGQSGEHVWCGSYWSGEEGGKSSNALHQLEEDGLVPRTEGVVVCLGAQHPGFYIITRTRANDTWTGHPLIGHLTATGLRELQAAADNNTITEVVFSKCGLLIDATTSTTT